RSQFAVNLLPVYLIDFITSFSCGYFSALKKSFDLRCVSRFSMPVSTEAVSAVASSALSLAVFGSALIVAVAFLNWPVTLEKPRWRATKPMCECAASKVHSTDLSVGAAAAIGVAGLAAGAVGAAAAGVAGAAVAGLAGCVAAGAGVFGS